MSITIIARELAEKVLARMAPPPPRAITLPNVDDETIGALESIGYAEGQSFAIEYIDSSRKASTRRITVSSIVSGSNGIPSLMAFCHERKAMRQFRVDRIQCFIDYDGEVFSDVPRFLHENFGMDLATASKTAPPKDRWATILDNIRHDAVIMAALAEADGWVKPEEMREATEYLCMVAERFGVTLGVGDPALINRYASRLRPSEDAILRALNHFMSEDAERVKRLLIAAVRVIDADGTRHPKELAMINGIAQDLIGASIF